MEEFFSPQELKKFALTNVIEPRGFVLSRGKIFEIFFTGPVEMHRIWLKSLKPCCILHKFKKKYKIVKQIGIGSKSLVKEVVCLENGEVFAVKEFDKLSIKKSNSNDSKMEKKIFLAIENEINIMRITQHENTIKLYEVYENKRQILLIMEILRGGDLYTKFIDPTFIGFQENEAKYIIKQLLLALQFLHNKEIMHRDIKPENIIFKDCKDLALKLGDVGLAEFENKKTHLLVRCGTPGYLAPEILKNEQYNRKVDLFGVGVILYIMYIDYNFIKFIWP